MTSRLLIKFFSPVGDFGFGITLIPSANSIDIFVSVFAPFLLILQGIRNTIGCKSETKCVENKLFAGGGRAHESR